MVIVYPEEQNGETGLAESIEKPRRQTVKPIILSEPPMIEEPISKRKAKKMARKQRRVVQQRSGGLSQFRLPSQPVPDLPQEGWHQKAFHDMMGGGNKIWGWKNRPVEIYETLTSGEGLIKGSEKLSDSDVERGTARMFGF